MKKLFLTSLLIAFAWAAMSAEPAKKPSFAGFVSNGFWDNWEISAGIGVGTAFTSGGAKIGAFGDRLGFEGNISVTKWLHPVAGLRLELQGGRFNNFYPDQGLVKWPYVGAHLDLMVNISNWIGGYREERAYYAIPYVGMGFFSSCFTDSFHDAYGVPTQSDFGFVYGWLNKFRISRSVDFNIDLKGMVFRSRFSSIPMYGRYLLGFSATAGFTYRFNKRGWERGVAGYTSADIRAFQQAVESGNAALAEAQEANNRLAWELAEAKDAAKAAQAAAAVANNTEKTVYDLGMPVIFFPLGKATLDGRNKVRLDLIADQVSRVPNDVVFSIQGHADPQTGTPTVNDRLSSQRAKAVYEYLLSKGVPAERMSCEGMGTKDNPFKTPETNRVAVIKFK